METFDSNVCLVDKRENDLMVVEKLVWEAPTVTPYDLALVTSDDLFPLLSAGVAGFVS